MNISLFHGKSRLKTPQCFKIENPNTHIPHQHVAWFLAAGFGPPQLVDTDRISNGMGFFPWGCHFFIAVSQGNLSTSNRKKHPQNTPSLKAQRPCNASISTTCKPKVTLSAELLQIKKHLNPFKSLYHINRLILWHYVWKDNLSSMVDHIHIMLIHIYVYGIYVYVFSSCTTYNISKPSYSLSSKTRPQRHWACLASASIFSSLAITPFSPSVNIPGGNISSWPIWELQSDSSSATFGSCNFSDMSWLDSMVFQYISFESK